MARGEIKEIMQDWGALWQVSPVKCHGCGIWFAFDFPHKCNWRDSQCPETEKDDEFDLDPGAFWVDDTGGDCFTAMKRNHLLGLRVGK